MRETKFGDDPLPNKGFYQRKPLTHHKQDLICQDS